MSEKNVAPTKKRLEKCRLEGQVSKSSFLTQCWVVTAGFFSIFYALRICWLAPGILLKFVYISGFADPVNTFWKALLLAFLSVVVCITPCALMGAVVESAQLGFRIYLGSGFNKTGRLSVTTGVKRIWSGISNLWLQVFLITSLCAVLIWFLRYRIFQLAELARYRAFTLPTGVRLLEEGGHVLFLWIVIAGAIEYSVRRRQHMQKLMMTADELKRELKESEGDPNIRTHRKMLHRALVMQDLEQRIRRSKVVIVERTKNNLSSL